MVTDLDGPVVMDLNLEGIQVLNYFWHTLKAPHTPLQLISPNRHAEAGHYNPIMYFLHYLRPVMPNAKRIIPILANYADIYGTTGRPNYESWSDITNLALMRANIFWFFTHIDYTPPGVSSTESKLATIKEVAQKGYKGIIYVENNPSTAIQIGEALADMPNLKIAIVEDLTSHLPLSLVDRSQLKNIRTVPSFTYAVEPYLPENVWLGLQSHPPVPRRLHPARV